MIVRGGWRMLAAASLPLAACSADPAETNHGGVRSGERDTPGMVACGSAPASLRMECSLARLTTDADGRRHLTLQKPGGGFRRVLLDLDGTLKAADGAEPLRTLAQDGGTRTVAIGNDIFRLTLAQLEQPQ